MGLKNKTYTGHPYFITLTVIDWVDIFTRLSYKQIIVDSLTYCQANKGLIIYAWVLMTNHVHLLVSTKEEHELSDIIRDFKKHTNKKLIEQIITEKESRRHWLLDRFEFAARGDNKHKNYKLWQEGYEPKELLTPDFIDQKLDYIHKNPVLSGIVLNPWDYLHSSASDYIGQQGLIKVDLIS